MMAFVQTLRPHEIAAANRNRNLVVNLFVFEVGMLGAQKLVEWVRFMEACGIEVTYVAVNCFGCGICQEHGGRGWWL